MPKIKDSSKPFEPVVDPLEVQNDPLVRRALALFDSLRKRNVGPERAAYCVSQVFGPGANNSHPTPNYLTKQP